MFPFATYQARQAYWFDYTKFDLSQLPITPWICLVTSDIDLDEEQYEAFVRHAIDNGILAFKAHGKFAKKLHDVFDEILVQREVIEGHKPISVVTTWHEDESLASVFWQCFFANGLSEVAATGTVAIVCTDLGGKDRSSELKGYLERFEAGWVPN